MSFFTCVNPVEVRNKFCFFANVSACGDHVSQFICNNHAALFGIKYRIRSYCDGMNNTSTRINTYITTNHNFHIPLFITAEGKIMVDEIKTFCQNIQQLNDQQRNKFEQSVGCLVGLNTYSSTVFCDGLKGWLGDSATKIIVLMHNGVAQELNVQLPDLHKALFYYTRPTVTEVGTTQIYAITNISLVGDETNTSFAFSLINPSNILKLTLPNSEATPLVLHAITTRTPKPETRTFAPMSNTTVC